MKKRLRVFLLLPLMSVIFTSTSLIGQQLSLTPSNFNGYNVSCFGGQNGSINLTITGGTSPYTILWSTTATTEDISNLRGGYYRVTVDDADSLTGPVSAEITLTEPQQLGIVSSSYVYPNQHNISLYGACNGSIDITPTNGVPPFTYLWSDGITTQDRNSICANAYKITVTDNNSCSKISESILLSQPDRSDWQITGNSSINSSQNFIGTSDANDLAFRTNALERIRIKANGDITISAFSSTFDNMVYSDPSGLLKTIPIIVPSNCLGNLALPWKVSPFVGDNIFSCSPKVGLGVNDPRVRLEIKGDVIISKDDAALTSLADYLKISHDGIDAHVDMFYSGFSPGSILIAENYNNVKIGTGPNGGSFTTGKSTFLSINGGTVGIGTTSIPTGMELAINGDTYFSGNVGIGTATPSGRFEIKDVNTSVYITENSTNSNSLNLKNNDGSWHISGPRSSENGKPLSFFWYNNSVYSRIISLLGNGTVAIGIDPDNISLQGGSSPYKLIVNGKMGANEIWTSLGNPWPDYVFKHSYNLLTLQELEEYVLLNNHFPGMLSAYEIEANGKINLAETIRQQQEKLEEAYLYIFELKKEINEIKGAIQNTTK